MATTTNKPTTAKKPQDRKPKAAELPGYTFTGVDGAEYTLPSAQPVVESAPLRITRAMLRSDDTGQFLAALDLLDTLGDEHRDAVEAVLDMPNEAGSKVVGEWLSTAAGEGEATPGESSGSEG